MYTVTGHTLDGSAGKTIACSPTEIRGAYRSLGASAAWIDVAIENQRVEIAITRAGCKAGVKVSDICDPRDFSVVRVGHRCPNCT
jgi:hypothetical protein